MKAIFFDFDGVLTTEFNGTGNIAKNLCRSVPSLRVDEVTTHLRKDCGHLMRGGLFRDAWPTFCKHIGQEIPEEILWRALREIPVNEGMFALARSLQQKYILGIITDNAVERMDLLNEDLHLPELFNPIIVSAKVHALKHDGTTTIFEAALKAAGCKASESIFIDNQEKNLTIPAQMGMKTYWHDDAKNDLPALRMALEKLGVIF